MSTYDPIHHTMTKQAKRAKAKRKHLRKAERKVNERTYKTNRSNVEYKKTKYI